MGELKNTFSWSFSAANDFEECRRRRYWSKYGMWGGWDSHAPELAQKAYQLNKMDNIYSLRGTAAEMAVMCALRHLQDGEEVTVDAIYQKAARPYLNKCWKESKEKQWRINAKRHCCLREHYYNEWDAQAEKEQTVRAMDHIKMCITNFIERVWPRLTTVKRGDELVIAQPDQGDPEHFTYNGIKIYSIPDYGYHREHQVHIHDWKSGRVRAEHREQLCLYGLWAHTKLDVPPESILAYDEYLAEGKVAVEQLSAGHLDEVRGRIDESVMDMAEYLLDGDIQRNMPLAREEWDLAPDTQICRRCNFFELCRKEIEGE